jgi:hypothetical protein
MNGIRPCTVGPGEFPTVRGGPFPFDVEGYVTSNFGPRESFTTAAGVTSPFHYGTDLGCIPPPPLLALTDGLVAIAEANNPEVGNWIRVDAGDGWTWDYYHLADAPFVQPGDEIRAGDVLGTMGATGKADGPHLHLGLAHNGINLDPLAELKLAPDVPEPGEQEEDVEVIKFSNLDELNAVKDAMRATVDDGVQFVGQIVKGYDVPAGYKALIAVVKETA